MTNLHKLPANLPAPIDDGACDHLAGMALPDLRLLASNGQTINLSLLSGRGVVYVYPMTGKPGQPLADSWDQIPGARGCTPQACNFRDHFSQISEMGMRVFGLSSQPGNEQQEAALRLQLPFLLLSDKQLAFASALNLPLFEFNGRTLIKRLTLVCRDGVIEHCFYPVFPPDKHAQIVVDYLRS